MQTFETDRWSSLRVFSSFMYFHPIISNSMKLKSEGLTNEVLSPSPWRLHNCIFEVVNSAKNQKQFCRIQFVNDSKRNRKKQKRFNTECQLFCLTWNSFESSVFRRPKSMQKLSFKFCLPQKYKSRLF